MTATMPSRDLLLLDTITAIDDSCAGAVIVSGSHGGVSSSGFVERATARPHAVFFNDAGVGKDRSGGTLRMNSMLRAPRSRRTSGLRASHFPGNHPGLPIRAPVALPP